METLEAFVANAEHSACQARREAELSWERAVGREQIAQSAEAHATKISSMFDIVKSDKL